MNTDQEPKYKIVDGEIVNRASGEAIPSDEPIMIFRGKDNHAAKTIRNYAKRVSDEDHRATIFKRAEQFEAFAKANPDRMHEPDTAEADEEAETEEAAESVFENGEEAAETGETEAAAETDGESGEENAAADSETAQ